MDQAERDELDQGGAALRKSARAFMPQTASAAQRSFTSWCGKRSLAETSITSLERYLVWRTRQEDRLGELNGIIRDLIAINHAWPGDPPLSKPPLLNLLEGLTHSLEGRYATSTLPKDVVHTIRRSTIASVDLIRNELHYNRAAISQEVSKLLSANVVQRAAGEKSPVMLSGATGTLVGVEITGNRATVALASADYQPITEVCSRGELPMQTYSAALSEVASLIKTSIHEAGVDHRRLVGIALCLPGPIHRADPISVGRPLSRAVLTNWRARNVAEDLQQILLTGDLCLDPPRVSGSGNEQSRRFVTVENDASAGALGVHTRAMLIKHTGTNEEKQALPRSIDDLLYVRVTAGVGAGVVLKGHLVSGANGLAGEIGHMRVGDAEPICSKCGTHCLEAICSETAFVKRLSVVEDPSVAGAIEAFSSQHEQVQALLAPFSADSDDDPHPAVIEALRNVGWHLGIALAHAGSLLNLKWIVLGGAMTATDPFKDAVKHSVERNAEAHVSQGMHISNWHELTPEPGQTPELMGALAKVMDDCGDDYYLDPVKDWANQKPRPAEIDWG